MRGVLQTPATMKAIVTKDGETVEVQDKADLEEVYQYENIHRSSQSSNTPFLNGSLLEDVGLLVEVLGTEEILEE